ncbi:hypothetical protein DL240_09405 [Lujinxingia litoralis]|uniref:RING-type E3 ubiquitin transferase n=1 Tax=Lujinxingia litoralis TaxID=2211119 RepID=A0A328C7N7_9DELT|nr:LemA family protein [Lujinxingia litoralis]RAL23092.1 hypothetical protein DL240_09405 [Lujinxingia litoralis]
MSEGKESEQEGSGLTGKLGLAAVGALLMVLGLLAGLGSFSELGQARQLDRGVIQRIGGALPGGALLRGEVVSAGEVFRATGHDAPCVYHLREEYKRQGSGSDKKKWHRVLSKANRAPFTLKDDSGQVAVHPNKDVNFRVEKVYEERTADRRIEEYCLEVGATATVMGMVRLERSRTFVDFENLEGLKPAIVSGSGERARADASLVSYVFVLVALLLVGLGVWALFNGLGFVSVGGFVSLMTVVMLLFLSVLGLRLTLQELKQNQQTIEQARTATEEVTRDLLGSAAKGWKLDWAHAWNYDAAPFKSLSRAERERVQLMRANLATMVEQARRFQSRPPEVLFALALGYARPAEVVLNAEETALKPDVERVWRRGLTVGQALLGGLLTGLLGLLFSWLGLREIRGLRVSRSLPTPAVEAVVYGTTELKGRVEVHPDHGTVLSPLKQRPCVMYTEAPQTLDKRGDGKKSGVGTRSYEARPFYCVDATGKILIEPDGVELLTDHHEERKVGKDDKQEFWRLEEGDEIYVLGTAVVEEGSYTTLKLGRGAGEVPFIISTWKEARVQRSKAKKGTGLLAVGVVGVIGAALSVLGMVMTFSPLMFTGGAMVVCAWALVMPVIFLFNDMVFMRLRVDRAWANIEVSLKKRFDLITALEEMVRGMFDHEQALHQAVSSARERRERLSKSREGLEAVAEEEEVLARRMMGVLESYPELRSDEQVARLGQALRDVENELMLMRSGYNEAVTFYNTRRERFPQKLVAAPMGFVGRPLWDEREQAVSGVGQG